MNFEDVRLLPVNPRFTEMDKINFSKLNFEDYNEYENIKKLLKYEDDLSDLYKLVLSISKKGFLFINDNILVKTGKDGFKYVLEGNRRLMSLKIIKNVDIFENIKFSDISSIETSEKEWNNNKEKIISLISKENMSTTLEVDSEAFKNIDSIEENKIWQMIYSKHVGEQSGKRNWSRAKYFKDIFDQYVSKMDKEKDYEKVCEEISDIFGKDITIIKSDIMSSIWIVRSLNLFNKNRENPVDINNMEISGFELLLNRTLQTDSGTKNLRKILGFKIDKENEYDFSFSEKYNSNKEEIIRFFVENSLNKKITTREIKEEIFDELSELLDRTLGIKSLELRYKKLLNMQKNGTLNEESFDNSFLKFLKMIKNDLKIEDRNKYKDHNDDSRFILSIKYVIRNELQTMNDFKKFDETEYPFSNVGWAIRVILELMTLELIYRCSAFKEFKKYKEINISETNISKMHKVIDTYKKPDGADHGKILGAFIEVIEDQKNSHSSISSVIEKILKVEKKFLIDHKKYLELFSKIYYHLNKMKNTKSNYSILNNLVHKPYYGFENKNEKWFIDGLNESLILLKELLNIMDFKK